MRDYISKLNDRNLQRKRESGFTTYALITVIVIAVYKLFEIYLLLPVKTNFWEIVLVLSYTMNIVVPLIVIYSIYSLTLGNLSSIRIISRPTRNDRLFENVLDVSTLVFPLLLDVAAAIFVIVEKKTWNWYLISMGIVYIVVLCSVIHFNLKDRKLTKPYEIFEGTGKVNTDKEPISKFCYLLSLISIILSLYYLYTTDVVFSKSTTALFGILLYSIPVLLINIIEEKKKDRFSTSLENLEYEINIRELTDEEIRERLQKHYMGFLLKEWVAYNLVQLEKFRLIIEEKKRIVLSLKDDLVKVDSNKYPIEYQGRLEKIEYKTKDLNIMANKFFNLKLSEIECIWFDSKLELDERGQLSELYYKIKFERDSYEQV